VARIGFTSSSGSANEIDEMSWALLAVGTALVLVDCCSRRCRSDSSNFG